MVGLYAKGNCTLDQIQRTVKASSTLNLTNISHIQELLQNIRHSSPAGSFEGNAHFAALERYLDNSLLLYSDIDTEYRRRKLLVSQGLVMPTTYKIGTRRNVSATGVQQTVDVTAQYVSVVDTLSNIKPDTRSNWSHPLSLPTTMKSYEDTATFQYSDFYRAHPSAFRLTLYHDDIECGNNVGSRAGVNKLTMFYMAVNNGTSERQTKGKLTSIHLVLICHASDITQYGYGVIMKPLLNDLIRLDQGVQIANRFGDSSIIHGRLEHLAGDNLAANQLLGLVTSFTKSYFCRFCYISAALPIHYTTALDAPKRTAETHQRDVLMALNDPEHYKTSGVKGACVFDELDYFCGVEHTVPDIM